MATPSTFDAARRKLAFALDYPTLAEARVGASCVASQVGVLKVGLELFVREGPAAARLPTELGCDAFLDLKLHDIPETVERAVANACQLGVRYLTLHVSGGPRMMEQAAQRVVRENVDLTLLGVTVLTSLDTSDLLALGVEGSPGAHARRLALLAQASGLRGCVCSAAEVAELRQAVGIDFVLVTPGIRLSSAGADDQKRVGRPRDAIQAGSSILVVGRPIRDASDPAQAAAQIVAEIASA
ncbi:MAG TPA: orotidine-5'-phosphate decarboxylase [Polyangiaceae bacterium]|nr:orotidine-5'-phosphate decarboxylase [Polyangiaceae bacterium]